MNNITRLNERGSSLIALSFIILILGFAITLGASLYQNYTVVQDDQKSVDNSRDIQNAISAFVEREGRFPCPAPLDAEIDTARFGQETDCSSAVLDTGVFHAEGKDNEKVRIGTIPTRTLNISDNKMIDGYNKRYVYAVTERMATPGTLVNTEQGVIYLINENGHSVSKAEGNVVYALVSYDQDDRGAYDINGALIQPCDITSEAGKNCSFQNVTNGRAEFTVNSSKTYNVGSESFPHSFAFFSNEVPYRWRTGSWSICGKDVNNQFRDQDICFVGGQERTVDCRDENRTIVNNALCAAHTQIPDDERQCVLPPCDWRVGAFGSCSASFAGGANVL